MKSIKNECVCCPPELGCLGAACPNRNVEVWTCDNCGDEAAYEYEGDDYCVSCLIARLIDDGVIDELLH